jgi:hypothetical protein
MKRLIKNIFLLCCLLIYGVIEAQTIQQSAQQKSATAFIDSVGIVKPSIYWPNINATYFLKNLKKNITNPLFIHGGNGTNFCSYAALSYRCIGNYPERYARFMIALYTKGEACFGDEYFNPSLAIKRASGLMKFVGVLDINHADQIWFLSLADHFKGYVNFFNHKYHTGNENGLWASTNFSKFNRMIGIMCNYNVKSVGWDLRRPFIKNIPEFLKEKLAEGEVFVYLNNTILHKKNHNKLKKRIPTHYIVLLDIQESNGLVNLTYWDYGFKTLQQLTPKVVKHIVYGISWCTKKNEW